MVGWVLLRSLSKVLLLVVTLVVRMSGFSLSAGTEWDGRYVLRRGGRSRCRFGRSFGTWIELYC
jgi:hypothetical protein